MYKMNSTCNCVCVYVCSPQLTILFITHNIIINYVVFFPTEAITIGVPVSIVGMAVLILIIIIISVAVRRKTMQRASRYSNVPHDKELSIGYYKTVYTSLLPEKKKTNYLSFNQHQLISAYMLL